jgi:sortase (surface protein transpeptidase)
VTIEVPYATFVYSVTGYRVVPANDLAVLRSPHHELLELQACHPRFFATHRYIVYARLVRVEPRGGTPYDLAAAAQTSGR